MNDFQLIPVEAGLFYTFDFSEELTGDDNLQSVAFTCTPPLALSVQSDEFSQFLSTIKVSGAVHGTTYNLQAKASLTSGETLVKDVCLIGFNG